MESFKEFTDSHYKSYLVCLFILYLVPFFISWDIKFGDHFLYPFITQAVFPILGIATLLMALVSKKISLMVAGIVFICAFWLNMMILFNILPIFIGN